MKLKLKINTGYAGANHEDEIEIPDEELEGLAEHEKSNYFDECLQDFINNNIEAYWEIVE
jgi:hypothetical protein